MVLFYFQVILKEREEKKRLRLLDDDEVNPGYVTTYSIRSSHVTKCNNTFHWLITVMSL